jgi:hypothetical protein
LDTKPHFNYQNFKDTSMKVGKYWIGANSIGCSKKLRWCDNEENPIITNGAPHLTWKKGEPNKDPRKACVRMEYQKSPPYLLFSKEDCSTRAYLFHESIGPIEKSYFYRFLPHHL